CKEEKMLPPFPFGHTALNPTQITVFTLCLSNLMISQKKIYARLPANRDCLLQPLPFLFNT
ncbi:hypothetical protein ACQP3F_29115, partial [Escherichia coli]